MFIKFRTKFFHKNPFLLLIAASLAIHGLIIFLSPKANQIFTLRSIRESFIREPSEYSVVLELENPEDAKREKKTDLDKEQNKNEQKKEDKNVKKKDKTFIDTSDNKEDEKTNVDTDKIGEKGSVAKDNFPDTKQPINNEPHAEGRSDAPLLGKGVITSPHENQEQVQEPGVTKQSPVSGDASYYKNSPPRFANLPQGLGKQGEPLRAHQMVQPQIIPENNKGKTVEGELPKPDKIPMKAENIKQTAKKERVAIGHSIRQEEGTEPISYREGLLFTDKQDEINNGSKLEEDSLLPLQEQEIIENDESELKKEDVKEEKPHEATRKKNTKGDAVLESEKPPLPTELPDVEPQRRLERGLDEQENPGELAKPKVSFSVNAKEQGSSKDPVLFEDTISNAVIPGAPSFHAKKHEYAAYFKHIRERISLYWFLGYGTRAEIKLETIDDKPIVVEFKVLPNGTIDGVKIVDDAGNFQLASRLISSIKNAAPLNPFPSYVKEPSIDVRFNFYFF